MAIFSMRKCDVVPPSAFACNVCGAEFESRPNGTPKVGDVCGVSLHGMHDNGPCKGHLYASGTKRPAPTAEEKNNGRL